MSPSFGAGFSQTGPFGVSRRTGSASPFGVGAFGSVGTNAGSAAFGSAFSERFNDTIDPLTMMRNNFANELARHQANGGMPPPGGTQTSNVMASPGGKWANVDRWNDYISEAAALYQVPANLLKAVMMLESGGDPSSTSPQDAQGLMQIMPFWDGTNGYSIHDPRQNVLLGAYILKNAYDSWAHRGAGNPWEEAVRDYIGRGEADAFGTDQHSYWKVIKGNWDELNSVSGGVTTGGNGVAGSKIEGLFGGYGKVHDWGEFNTPSNNGLYDYGTEYGLNGTNHTGLDVAMDFNKPFSAAFNGTVVCAGTGRGNGADSCDSFQDTIHGGVGRVQIMSEDGNTMLIYGHAHSSAFNAGDKVRAGDILGTSGGMNSDHIHLEARVRDNTTPSGWRIVDPRNIVNGGAMIPGTGGTPAASAGSFGGPFWLRPGYKPF